MTVSTSTSRVEYAGDGGTTAFAINFPYQAKSHIVATLINDSTEAETAWVLTTNYTLTDPGATGTLTALVAPASGYTLRIERTVPFTQTLDLIANDAFPSTSVEDALDLGTMRDGQLQRQIDDIYADPPSARAFLSGIGAPSDALGSDGDSYVDVTDGGDGTVYEKQSGSWVDTGGSLKGSQGEPGTTTVTGGVTGDTSSTIGNIATFDTTLGTSIEDSGVAVSNVVLKTGAQTIAGAKTFSDAVVIDDAATITGQADFSGAVNVQGVATFFDSPIVYSDDAGAGAAPYLNILRNSASPAADDQIGSVLFSGEDDGANYMLYGEVVGRIVDPTNGSEDGAIDFFAANAGSHTFQARFSQGLCMAGATDGAKGVGTINATGFYVNGTLLSGGKIGQVVTTSSTTASTISAATPHDNSIPQVGEGTQILSRTITPANASSTLLIDIEVPIYVSAVGASGVAEEVTAIIHLHKDGASNASWAAAGPRVKAPDTDNLNGSNTFVAQGIVRGSFHVTAGGTSSQTWTVRVGKAEIVSGGTGVVTVNGTATLGAVRAARITITEILP